MRTLIKDVFHPRYGLINMFLKDDLIESIRGNKEELQNEYHVKIDGNGYVVFPSLVDGHAHIDKTLMGLDWYVNDIGPERIHRIENERNKREELNYNYYEQASTYIQEILKLGVLHMRSHVDIDTQHKLRGLTQLLEVREEYKDLFDLEIVAFPQSGLISRPGTYELMEEGLKMGADLVGGIDPAWIDRDPKGSLDATFKLANKYDKPIDIHIHETGELGLFNLELIIDRVIAYGMEGKVTISHAFCLASPNISLVQPILEKIKERDIQIVSCYQAYQTLLPLKKFFEMGINIASGNDGVRDMWTPFGTGDILERMQLIAMKNGFRRDDDLELTMKVCTDNGGKLLGLDNYGIEVGCQADLVLVKGSSISECIVSRPSDRIVFRKGNLIARNGKLVHNLN